MYRITDETFHGRILSRSTSLRMRRAACERNQQAHPGQPNFD
jgi:hypothetical protein